MTALWEKHTVHIATFLLLNKMLRFPIFITFVRFSISEQKRYAWMRAKMAFIGVMQSCRLTVPQWSLELGMFQNSQIYQVYYTDCNGEVAWLMYGLYGMVETLQQPYNT